TRHPLSRSAGRISPSLPHLPADFFPPRFARYTRPLRPAPPAVPPPRPTTPAPLQTSIRRALLHPGQTSAAVGFIATGETMLHIAKQRFIVRRDGRPSLRNGHARIKSRTAPARFHPRREG